MTKQNLFQSDQQSQPSFAQGREIAPNATKGGGSGETAKAARNLLLHLDLLLDVGQLLGTALHQTQDGRRRDGLPEQIEEKLAHPFIGQQLLLYQVDRQRSQGGTLLHQIRHVSWKDSQDHFLASRTALVFGLMLDHHHAFGGNSTT